jgi:hypothetical protein
MRDFTKAVGVLLIVCQSAFAQEPAPREPASSRDVAASDLTRAARSGSSSFGTTDLVIGIGLGAAVGGSIDHAIFSPRRIYDAPSGVRTTARKAGFVMQFAF